MAVASAYETKLRPLFDVVDTLRNTFTIGEPIKLPTIVVVGDQSSGKSSVLESLSGVNLPRGQNIVTRCPLVLRMVKVSHPSEERANIGIKNQEPANVEFHEIATRVQDLTNSIAGVGQSISHDPINLTIYKRDCPDLTLVDLPGITRNPIGNQPADIYSQLKNLISTYVTPEETIILAVIPANIDFVTSEAISLSKEVDPRGERTVGVVTKIDMCEAGIRDKLEAKNAGNLALTLGFVAVRNRTQQEIASGMSFAEARTKERNFFKGHNELKYMQEKYLGTPELAKKLTALLFERIRTTLPKIRKSVETLMKEKRSSLSKLPLPPTNDAESRRLFMDALIKISHNVKAVIAGELLYTDKKLHVAARLYQKYMDYQTATANQTSNFLLATYHPIALEAVRESQGGSLPNFLSLPAFKLLIMEEIQKLEGPTMDLVAEVRGYYDEVIDLMLEQHFKDMPKVAELVKHSINEFLDTKEGLCTTRIQEHLEQEQDIFTIDTYYSDTVTKMKPHVGQPSVTINESLLDLSGLGAQRNLKGFTTTLEEQAAVDIRVNLFSYWKVVHKRLCDKVPMTIRYFFDKQLSAELFTKLNEDFSDTANIVQTIQEGYAHFAQERATLQESIDRLQTALTLLKNI